MTTRVPVTPDAERILVPTGRRRTTFDPDAMIRTDVLIVMLGLLLAAGCRQKMAQAPRYDPYEPSVFFSDSTSARPIPEGTVARGGARSGDRAPLLAGSDTEGAAGETVLPFPATERVLERGQQQFNVYCSPCHSRVGDGRGMIVQRGLQPPPSFHTERLRNAPMSHFFRVMTDGFGAMYSYADRVSPEDRWAIAAYIRALQLSQNAPADLVPPDRQRELGIIQP